MMRPTPLLTLAALAAAVAALVWNGDPIHAAQDKKTAVAKLHSVEGALLQRQGGKWQAVEKGASLHAGTLLVAVPRAEVVSANGTVGLLMSADIGKRGPYPVLESAVELGHDAKADLDFRLERGLIKLTNLRKEGKATVKMRVRNEIWTMTLLAPQTSVGLELYSRQLPSLHPLVEGKLQPPLTSVAMLVLKGKVELTDSKAHMLLCAPPGPARAEWNSHVGRFTVEDLDKLPKEVRPLEGKDLKLFETVCARAEAFNKGDIKQAIAKYLGSDDKVERLLGVTVAGAIDDLPDVVKALADPKHGDLRSHTVLVLRHWLGRDAGHTTKLFKELTVGQKYKLPQAKNIIQLLLGFREEDRFNPHTYELLIVYLEHGKLAIRELAHWHLVRLVPEGKEIAYDAGGAEAERQKGIAAWRKLIPAGKLPQTGKSDGNK
jgi:hypothetical protein